MADRRRPAPLRVLDVACGAGDVLVRLVRRAAHTGLRLAATGIDRSPVAISLASEHARATNTEVRFVVADALQGDWPGDYDAVVSSLFLHHLSDTDAMTLLRRMGNSAGRLVLVNDLRRSQMGYLLAWVGTRLLSRSSVVHYDGPISVTSAWTTDEALHLATASGLTGARCDRRWPFRFLLSWEKP
ncbi:MAG: methyltransferase domain-containing protein [Gemmataceae bacterium]